MTPFWLWVSAGCAASGLAGFSLVRFAARGFVADLAPAPAPRAAPPSPPPARAPALAAAVPTVAARRPPPAAARAKKVAPATPTTPPAPTAERPEAAKLALWARQVKAGERKMSVATDGCRVTWNRTCKHGHPSWLVHLGYLKRNPGPRRHNPR